MSLDITMGQALGRVLGIYCVPSSMELTVLLNKRTWFSVMTLSLSQNCNGSLAQSWEPAHPVIKKPFSNGLGIFQKGHPSSVILSPHFSDENTKAQDGGRNCPRVPRKNWNENSHFQFLELCFIQELCTSWPNFIYLFIYLCFLLTSLWKRLV